MGYQLSVSVIVIVGIGGKSRLEWLDLCIQVSILLELPRSDFKHFIVF